MNVVVSYVRYLQRMFWPVDLNIMDLFPHLGLAQPWPSSIILVSVATLTLITITAVALIRRAVFILVGWLWYLIAMLPVIGIVAVGHQATADRYAYLPFIGLYIALIWSAASLLRSFRAPRFITGAVVALACAALVCSAFATRKQIQYWKDPISLYQRALTVDPENWIIHYFIAGPLYDAGSRFSARDHLETSVRINPSYPRAWYALGVYSLNMNDPRRAIEALEISLKLDPNNSAARTALSRARDRLRSTPSTQSS
jgi:hypothetical protein